jgi:NIPSNAP
MKRREFLKTSVAASALTVGFGCTATHPEQEHAQAHGTGHREYYELRVYRLKDESSRAQLDGYLERTVIPALNRHGCKPVGVFVEKEPKQPAVFVLIPYRSLEQFREVSPGLLEMPEYEQSAGAYWNASKNQPAFDRIDSWLLLAFTGLPHIQLAPYSQERKPGRIFELRTYESHSESKALKKIEMFNSGEIGVMKEVGLAPVFYGQALIGANLPHLTYMTSGASEEEHKKHWDAFGKHPVWQKLKDDPKYADTVSKITKWILSPTEYSQI